MPKRLLSIRCRNVYGNIGVGACLVALGLSIWFDGFGVTPLVGAVALLILASAALFACVSRQHEPLDEMAVADEGAAASAALKVTLSALGITCCIGIVTGAQVNLGAVASLAIGCAMVLYGVLFAWFEKV